MNLPITNYAKEHIKIQLSPDIEEYFNYHFWRLLVCKWAYHPVGECERYQNKVKELIREVGYMQFVEEIKC